MIDVVSRLLLKQHLFGKLRDHWLSYITMTMLWCLGNFPVDLNLSIFMGFVFDVKAGFGPSRTSVSDLSVMSGVSGVRLQSDVWI